MFPTILCFENHTKKVGQHACSGDGALTLPQCLPALLLIVHIISSVHGTFVADTWWVESFKHKEQINMYFIKNQAILKWHDLKTVVFKVIIYILELWALYTFLNFSSLQSICTYGPDYMIVHRVEDTHCNTGESH